MASIKLLDDRREAGRCLASSLAGYARESPVVVGIARGGVAVACEIAELLDAPLDFHLVDRVTVPGYPDLGFATVSEAGNVFRDAEAEQQVGALHREMAAALEATLAEVRDRSRWLRWGRPPIPVRDRTVILVDDGVATGATARVAVRALQEHEPPRRLVLAVAVGSMDTLQALLPEVDELVCVEPLIEHWAVSACYRDFPVVSDLTVAAMVDDNRGVEHCRRADGHAFV